MHAAVVWTLFLLPNYIYSVLDYYNDVHRSTFNVSCVCPFLAFMVLHGEGSGIFWAYVEN